MFTTSEIPLRELAHRTNDGIDVTLWFCGGARGQIACRSSSRTSEVANCSNSRSRLPTHSMPSTIHTDTSYPTTMSTSSPHRADSPAQVGVAEMARWVA